MEESIDEKISSTTNPRHISGAGGGGKETVESLMVILLLLRETRLQYYP